MERVSFPQLVGDTSFERVKAVIYDTLGTDTNIEFKIFWHDRSSRIKKVKPENNVVVLHMDNKWNCVLKTPKFMGYTHTLANYEDNTTSDDEE